MKILITTDTYAPTINGVVTSIKNLSGALTALGHEVRILTLAQDPAYEGFHDNVYYLRSFKCAIYPDARVTIAFRDPILRDIQKWKPDVIHSQTEFSSFLCAKHLSKRLGIPIVHTYHTLYEDYTHYFCPNQVLGSLAVRRFTRMLSKSVSLLCAPSAKVQRTLLSYAVQAPIAVLPTGIDLSRFSLPLPEAKRRKMKRNLNLPEDCKILLALGRLAEEKNYDILLNNLLPTLRTYENTYCVVVGDGPHRANIEQAVVTLGITDKVRFTGMVAAEEVPAYYRLGDIFVCASSSETQGLTYLEAMASGLPQVVFQDACLNGVILQNKNGYQYKTSSECTAYLDKLLQSDELCRHISEYATEYSSRFGTETFGAHAASCYQALIESNLFVPSAILCK